MGTPAQVIEQAALSGFDEAHARKQQRKDMLTDEQHAIKRDDLLKTKDSIVAQLAAYKDAKGNLIPEMKDQHDQAMAALSQNQFDIGQLYDPIKAPGKLQQDWHYLRDRIHGIKQPKTSAVAPPQPSSAPASTPAAPAVYQKTMGAGPSTPAALPPVTPENGGMQIPNTPGFGPTTPDVPKGATPTMAVAKPHGLVEAGTIPIWNRPSVLNDDGTHSSELSISMGDDKGNQVLIPLIVGGKFLTPDGKMPPGPIPHNAQEWEKASPEWKALKMRAWQNYEKTGEHLGKFGGETAEDDVDAYAQVLHNRGSASLNSDTLPTPPAQTVTKASQPTWGQAQVLKHKAAAMQKAQQEAGLLASGAPLSPQQQAMSQFRTEELVHQAQIDSTLKLAEKLGLSETAMDELKQQLVGLKNVTPKPLTGAAGQPYLGPDGLYRQAVTNPDGTVGFRQMPPDWKPSTKSIRGTLVNTKEHGWIQTWVNALNPSQVVGWQKVTPGSRYTGTTSSSSSTDPFGITTSTSRSTMPTSGSTPVDVDLSGMQQLPDNYNGEDNPNVVAPPPSGSPNKNPAPSSAPPKSVAKPATGGASQVHPKTGATPSQLMSRVPAPPTGDGKHSGNAYFNSLVSNVLAGKMAPSELSGRGADKLAIMARASELDPTFDPSKADSDYKYANEKSTRDLLNYLNSLTGRNGKGGNLADLVQKSDLIDRTDFPPLNDKIGWAKINSGSREMAEYYTTITEVADQVAKILQGGGSGGGTSDAKLKQASELFDKGFTKDQIRGVADSLTSLLGNRKDAIIGDNYYLNRWYKPKPEHFLYARNPDGKIKRKQADDQSPLPAGWTMMPQGWTPNAAAATK